ncbi:MAG: flavodoxin family protein [Spirochaetales bacterium]|nr:flavodoxin family protein [Spirochaetales bacterium]
MLKVIILYAPEDKSTNNPVNNIKTAFENEKCVVLAKSAKNTTIPDITASEILIIGSKTDGKKSIHPEFKELTRALKGINLAGRTAGIFSFDNEKTVTSFKEVLHDSGISLYNLNLYFKNEMSYSSPTADAAIAPSAAATGEWVKDIITFYKDGI